MQQKATSKDVKSIPRKNILIYGVGSLGSYLVAKLYAAGHNVDVIGRERAQEVGDVLYINGQKHKFPKVSNTLDPSKKYDYVFLTSKYYDLKTNLESIMNSGLRFDTVVSIQNTYFDSLFYYHLVKDRPFVTLSVFEGFNLQKDQLKVVEFAGWFVEDDVLGKDIYLLLKDAGVNISLTDDINAKRAEKTIYNCALNVFSATYDKTYHELYQDKDAFAEMKEVFSESYDVMSEIVPLRSKKVLFNNLLTILKTMDHYASTHQDVKRNKKTEISFINGFIIDMGKKMNIPTPRNRAIVNKFIEKYPELY